MCTAVIYKKENEYGVGFNRDESRLRLPASPPEKICRGEMEILMPRDGDFGGTWLGVNNRGLICGLLNYYDKQKVSGRFISRGLLVRDMLTAGDFRLPEDPSQYQAFRMFLVDRDVFLLYTWDGDVLKKQEIRSEWLVLGSSGAIGSRVEPVRRELFEKKYYDRDNLSRGIRQYLLSHDPEKGAWSPCMHREDAQTVSMSCLKVAGSSVSFDYHAGSPCVHKEELRQMMNIIIP